MADRLAEYRRKRDARRTPEPVPEPAGPLPRGRDDTFVIQQHHARRLHWDLRLERAGTLVSWAVPRGIPRDPETNHLAVHTEDHPLEYAEFSGEIPAGEYGGGRMFIYDRGTYETEKWRDNEVIFVLHGTRVSGRYVLFQTHGKDWMIHRMDPPEPGWTPMPAQIPPMGAEPAYRLPPDDDAWAYELMWDGIRALAYVSGGQVRLLGSDCGEITKSYPELRAIAESVAPTECVLDGTVVAFDNDGRMSLAALGPRLRATDTAAARRAASHTPIQYLIFDVLWLNGVSTADLPYRERRELLDTLVLTGPHWQVPPHFTGGGSFALEASRAQGLDGVVSKRLDSPYAPGRRTGDWLRISNAHTERVVIVGWRAGTGRRAGTVGSLLIGAPEGGAIVYRGHVSSGLTLEAAEDLMPRLRRLARRTPPVPDVPAGLARNAHWVSPKLTGDVSYTGRTPDGRLRQPRWLGLASG